MVTERSTDTAEPTVDGERQTAAVETEAGAPQAAPRQLMVGGLPPGLPPHPTNLRLRQQALLQLQSSHGNAYVQQLLAPSPKPEPPKVADPQDAALGASAGPSADGPFDRDGTKEGTEDIGANGELSSEPGGGGVIQRQAPPTTPMFKDPVAKEVELGLPFVDQSLKIGFGPNVTVNATLGKKGFFEELTKKLTYSDIISIYPPAVAYVNVGPKLQVTGNVVVTLSELAPGPVAEGAQAPRRYRVSVTGRGVLDLKLEGSIGAGIGASGGGVGVALVGYVGLEGGIKGQIELGGTFWADTDSSAPYSGDGTVKAEASAEVKGTGGIRLAWMLGDESGDVVKIVLVEKPIAMAKVQRKYSLRGLEFDDVTEGERESFEFYGLEWEKKLLSKGIQSGAMQMLRESLGIPPDADPNDPAVWEAAQERYNEQREQEIEDQREETASAADASELAAIQDRLNTEELPTDEFGITDRSEQTPLAKAYETLTKLNEQRAKVRQLERDLPPAAIRSDAAQDEIDAAKKELAYLEYQYQNDLRVAEQSGSEGS